MTFTENCAQGRRAIHLDIGNWPLLLISVPGIEKFAFRRTENALRRLHIQFGKKVSFGLRTRPLSLKGDRGEVGS